MCNIRRASERDYPALKGIWEETVRATHAFLTESDIMFYKERMGGYFGAVDLFIYETGSGAKGFSGIKDGKLEMLFVVQRGTGIGSALLAHAIKEMHVSEVDVNEENPQALGFYLRHGFEPYSRHDLDTEGKPHPIIEMKLKNRGI